MNIWSKRHSPAKGWHYVKERACTHQELHEWLRVFREDEPDVEFVGSVKAPKF